MRFAGLLFVVLSMMGVAPASAAERTLSIEAELLGPKDKSLGKTQVLVAARGTERAKGTFAGITLVLDTDVGPTFDKDCNLVTLSGRLEDVDLEGKPRKRELKRITVHACGASNEVTLPSTEQRVLVTIRPAT
jgi:serine protease inhibitor ecotin